MHSPKQLLVSRTKNAGDLPLPSRGSSIAAGLDLYANVNETIYIKTGERVLVPTGIRIALPFGFEAQIRPRSGLALKHGITVLNSPGTIDADYRGEVSVILINHGHDTFMVNRGDRIAQMVVNKIEMFDLVEVSELPDSKRGAGGFGSSGI